MGRGRLGNKMNESSIPIVRGGERITNRGEKEAKRA